MKISSWFCGVYVPPHCINSLVRKLFSFAVFGTPGYKLQDLIFFMQNVTHTHTHAHTHTIRGKNHTGRTTNMYKTAIFRLRVCCVVRESNPAPCDKACTSFGAKWLSYCYKMVAARIYEMQLTPAILIFKVPNYLWGNSILEIWSKRITWLPRQMQVVIFV